jgi:hypothetical protein
MLRFTHDGLDSRAAYAHGQHGKKSVYESLHDSCSKRSHPKDFLFDIAIKDVLIYTISNRRFASLRAYHSWSWDKLLFVRCEVVSKGKRPHQCKTSQCRSATLTDWCPRGWRGCGSWRSTRKKRVTSGDGHTLVHQRQGMPFYVLVDLVEVARPDVCQWNDSCLHDVDLTNSENDDDRDDDSDIDIH